MKNRFTYFKIALFSLFVIFFVLLFPKMNVKAADLDRILNYEITVDVNEADATLLMHYHIDWMVLDDTEEGPLSWVKIGIPNNKCKNITALSSNIKKISYSSDDGDYIKITFDRDYMKGEVVSFDFEFTQDYMYQMDMLTKGETVYQFTPGWFDEIAVDKLTIRWNADKTISISPAALLENGYYTWEKPLKHGEKYTISITYKNDAFGFDTSKKIKKSGGFGSWLKKNFGIFCVLVAVGIVILIDALKTLMHFIEWVSGAGTKGVDKKIEKTIIEYHTNCPNCGSPRPEGVQNCPYCNTNFIKSQNKIVETRIPKKFKEFKDEILKSNKDGVYPLSGGNTFVSVHSISVPRRVPFLTYLSKQHAKSSSSRSSGGGCAHSSCACACACACAGGGRAGCTAKDFYHTDVKLAYLEKYAKK